jgi:O-antigen ligase
MSQAAATITLPRAPSVRRTATIAAGALVLVILGAGLTRALEGVNIPLALALAGGVVLIGFLLLAIRHYDTAVAIGLLLMGIVRFEPAPPDLAFAVIISVAAVTGRFRLRRVPAVLRWVLAATLVINVVSMVDVVSLTEASRFLFISLYLVIFALWLTAYVDRPFRARRVVVTWLWIGVASTVVSLLALNLPGPARSLLLSGVDNSERASGFFKDPNVFGPFLIPIALIVLELWIAPRVPRLLRMRPVSYWVALLILALGVLFSYSRAAWANFAIGVVVMLAASSLRRRGARRALQALVTLLLIAGAALVVLSAMGSIGFLEQRAHLQSYDTQRFAAQSLGWQLGWTHPVGIGPGQFELYSPLASHSTFVRVFAEQGFIGLVVLVALMLSTLVVALRNVVVGRDTYGIGSTALLGAWCGLIFNSVVVDTLHWRHLWVVAALIWAGVARGSSPRTGTSWSAVRRADGPLGPPGPGPKRAAIPQPERHPVPSAS